MDPSVSRRTSNAADGIMNMSASAKAQGLLIVGSTWSQPSQIQGQGFLGGYVLRFLTVFGGLMCVLWYVTNPEKTSGKRPGTYPITAIHCLACRGSGLDPSEHTHHTAACILCQGELVGGGCIRTVVDNGRRPVRYSRGARPLAAPAE